MNKFLLALMLLLVCLSPAAADTWKAGVAKVNITPTEPMWMAGYASRTKPAEDKLTALWAKALVLEAADNKQAVLVTLDLIGIDRELALSIRQQIATRHKLQLSQIALATSHTHSGPVVARNLRPMHWLLLNEEQQQQVSDYATLLEKAVVEVVDQAFTKLTPAYVSYGNGQATFATNRRNNKEAEFAELKAAGKIVGPFDHDVPVLAVKDETGKLLSVVFGYACHATVLDGYAWCGDYPGYAQIALEKAHPDAVAMFWAGCGGDQNPFPRRKVELAENYGQQLAQAVNKVLESPLTDLKPKLSASYVEIDLPLAKLPTPEELATQAESKDRYLASRAKYWLAEVDAGRGMATTYPYPIARWELGGEIEWLFLGGEVVVDFALRLKSESREAKTWVAGYSNDVMAYSPSRRVLTEGGYEGGGAMVYYGLPTVWAETVEEDIVKGVSGLRK